MNKNSKEKFVLEYAFLYEENFYLPPSEQVPSEEENRGVIIIDLNNESE